LRGATGVILKVLVPLSILGAGNILFHTEAYVSGAADVSIRIGEAAILLLIMIIGGRIIPSLTRNWLSRENPGRMPVAFGPFDAIVIAVSAAALTLWIAQPLGTLTGLTLIAASGMQAIRLGRWAGERTTRARLVLVLHLAYLFLPLGFFLTGLAAFEFILPSAGTHAWMTGGAGRFPRDAGDLYLRAHRRRNARTRRAVAALGARSAACRRVHLDCRFWRLLPRLRTDAPAATHPNGACSRMIAVVS
jgi:uncharacterized protein involved in response to NO